VGNQANIKALRGQVRQIVKELLPEVLHAEAVNRLNKDLTNKVDNRLEGITKLVKTTLDQLDQRSKDMQSYVVRNVGVPTAPEQTENK